MISQALRNAVDRENPHWVVEGTAFPTTRKVYVIALLHGYSGSVDTLERRLRAGADTWAALTMPVQKKYGSGKARSQRTKNGKAEMQKLIDEIETRRRAINGSA